VTLYLAGTSAWHWSARVAARWADFLGKRRIATCAPVKLELLYSARGKRDYNDLSFDLGRLPYLELDERVADAALRAQTALATRGQHRLPAVDFLVAALAEVNDAVLLHYDRHFDVIRRVTAQPMEWLARRGSLD
jgi:predicted nucleic acid-binding protein